MDNRRFYRDSLKNCELHFFNACVEQTDLLIGAYSDLKKEALESIRYYREQLEAYIRCQPEFLHSLVPINPLPQAPLIATDMSHAAKLAGVGPMAAVAGAISKYVGQELLKYSPEVMVENGGDIYLNSLRDRLIGIYAGESPLSGRLAIRLRRQMFPCGICTSSGTVGHSLSFGKTDAAVVICKDAALADACATALGNKVKDPSEIESALEWVLSIPGITGALVIMGKVLGAKGDIELTRT